MATEQASPEVLEPEVVERDPRRTMRAPFPQRPGSERRLKSLTDRVRGELTGDRLVSARATARRPAHFDA
jgi:hypothetical protein